GVDVDSKDKHSQTPLSWAAMNGHEAVVKLLLAKTSANTEDTIGRTPLSWAAMNGHDTVAMAILSHPSVDPDQEDHYGSTVLSIAVRNCRTEVVKALLATGQVTLDSQDCFGRTLWWWARRCGNTDIEQALHGYAEVRGMAVCDNDFIQLDPAEYSRLEHLQLHFNLPERAIICIPCGYALAADDDRVGRHLGQKHNVSKAARRKLNTFINSLHLPNPELLPVRPDDSAPHPHLRIQNGAACKHCGRRSTSLDVLSRHISKEHKREISAIRKTGKHWVRDHIVDNLTFQCWTSNDINRAWIVKSPPAPAKSKGNRPLQPAVESVQKLADQLYAEEQEHLGLQTLKCKPPAADSDDVSQKALLTNWMRRTDWDRIFENAECSLLISLALLPSPSPQKLYLGTYNRKELSSSRADEHKLMAIVSALDRLFDRCGETVRFTDTSVRRWLRGRFPDRPYKTPFELVSPSSERLYRREFKRCICFWLRLWRLPISIARGVSGRSISKLQRRMLGELWLDPCWEENLTSERGSQDDEERFTVWLQDGGVEATGDNEEDEADYTSDSFDDDTASETSTDEPENDERLDEAIHNKEPPVHLGQDQLNSLDEGHHASAGIILRFCYEMATEDFEDGRASSTLLVYFSAVRGLSEKEGAKYMRPAQYTPILARLVYCTRLVFLEAILPRRAYTYAGFPARPRYGQLAALNAVRAEKMCDGTMSPLGEFLSLLAYGLALRRSEGPVYHFFWSEDGQTISWDGNMYLTMDQFRHLAHKTFHQATVQCRRLMYDYEPDELVIGDLRDRLSETAPGYCFLTDDKNGLGDSYLAVFMRACTAPVDGLLKTRSHNQSAWDADAAQAYLCAHDAFLKTLMVLIQLDSGQGARVSELLTLEHSNTKSRLRGICIYGGQMFSVTRHHKARLTTNREFQVARFFSRQVTALMYRYLVYIRPVAYAILRKCFQFEPQRTLLFTPASKSMRWTTKVFTEELKRLGQDALGADMEINVQLYRQLSIAITERHVREALPDFNCFNDVTKTADADVAFAWQSGHRPMQRYATYGLDGAFPDKLQPSLLRLYARCSERWHDFLMYGSRPPPPERRATEDACVDIAGGAIQAENSLSAL
ncbi:hypothetical protein BFJ69_g15821, partial [Fusarium oxysporum]